MLTRIEETELAAKTIVVPKLESNLENLNREERNETKKRIKIYKERIVFLEARR